MFIIEKDGLYLASYRDTGIRETDSHGEFRTFYTGVFTTNKYDAIAFNSEFVADLFGGNAVKVSGNWKKGGKIS